MTILVTGATGNVFRHVVDELVREGQKVRALTRNAAAADLPDGVEVVGGDLTAPETLSSVFDRVTGMHLISSDEKGALQTGPDIVELAVGAGVQRATVLWSGERGPVEKALEDSGLEWTFLEPTEFMSNALGWAESVRKAGVVREAFGSELSAMVDEADIGRVAARVLVDGGHAGKAYALTGPEALTVAEKVAILGAGIGRDVRFIELTVEQARARLLEKGIPEDVADFVIGWHADPPAMAYTVVPAVEQVTGRPPRTFAQWVAEHAEAFTP